MSFLRKMVMAVCTLLPLGVAAQTVEVKEAWIRGTVPAQQASGAYLNLTSKVAARLVAIESPVAQNAEIHGMKMEKGVMKMFALEALELPAGKTVKLAPGGHHIMLLGLKQQLKAGERVPLRLTFEMADQSRQTLEIAVEVRNLKGEAAPEHRH
ncbi:MAG: copper chaperone PCu(A)C [Burkholderiales bacterium]